MSKKSIQTNFTLRLSGKTKPTIIGDESIARALSGANFYSITYMVDSVGIYLGTISEFLAIKCKEPIIIEFQRIDMNERNQIYCDSLFINHGDFGKVWLRVPFNVKPALTTVWYSTNNSVIDSSLCINIVMRDNTIKKLMLKNLNDLPALDVPIENKKSFIGLSHDSKLTIPVTTRKKVSNNMPTHKV